MRYISELDLRAAVLSGETVQSVSTYQPDDHRQFIFLILGALEERQKRISGQLQKMRSIFQEI